MDVNLLMRENVQNLAPYSSARSLNIGADLVLLDANENPFDVYGRYPDPSQRSLRMALSDYYSVDFDRVLAGNGSDELIDLLFRAFTEPGSSNVVVPQPTYGMYDVASSLQNCNVRKVLLNDDFSLNVDRLLAATDGETKMIFLCSPNNPSGNEFLTVEIEKLLRSFNGLVVIDQAYVDFSSGTLWRNRISEFSNLVVLQTFSKAWGMAALRVGFMFADPQVIDVLVRIKLPYNLNEVTQRLVLERLQNSSVVDFRTKVVKEERSLLRTALQKMKMVNQVYWSEANFVLVKFFNSNLVFNRLIDRGIVVRNRSEEPLCENALRISIGKPTENRLLIRVLEELDAELNQNVKLEV